MTTPLPNPAPVSVSDEANANQDTGVPNIGAQADPSPAATTTAAGKIDTIFQPAVSRLTGQPSSLDWRLKIGLAPSANYLYKDPQVMSSSTYSVLAPLIATDGVLFPYTPEITTAYRADYDAYGLTHSNYRGYFYKNSYVDAVNIRAVFTAQDGFEADYMLAMIHFFRSATKMFYGKDSQAGAPPPTVYMTGLGRYQYNNHPCLISQFNYDLPNDVDYVRAGSYYVNGESMLTQRPRASIATNPISDAVNRLKNAFGFLPTGGIAPRPAPESLSSSNVTYVPTKLNVQLTVLPLQNRKSVSQQFNVRDYASGTLLRKGYW